MSRLDKAIVRLSAQRALLDEAAAAARRLRPEGGLALELGLGNGRTYHHLRERLPGWQVVAFDVRLTAHPASVPAEGDLILGDIARTGPDFARRHGAAAALVHADMGDGVVAHDTVLERWLPEVVASLAAPEAIVLCSTRLEHAALQAAPYPEAAPVYEYFVYRKR